MFNRRIGKYQRPGMDFDINKISGFEPKEYNAGVVGPISGDRYKNRAQITQTLLSSDIGPLRQLSHYFWRVSGIYRSLVEYYANMLTYDVLLSPMYRTHDVQDQKVIEDYYGALEILNMFKLKQELPKIMLSIVRDGVYFGFLREEQGQFLLQDLPIDYCRTLYKNINGINLVEFDVRMFDTVAQEKKDAILKQYPKEIQKGYADYLAGRLVEPWIMIDEDHGMAFYGMDTRPWIAAAAYGLLDLDEQRAIEKQKDKNEVAFLLTQKMPINKDGELLFELEETQAIHKAVVKMLQKMESMNVMTTFGDVSVHGLQNARQGAKDNIEKSERGAFLEAGASRNLFSGEGNASLQASIEAMQNNIFALLPHFGNWFSHQINLRFSNADYFFQVSVLPITHYNRSAMVDMYTNGATLGYSKLLPGIASGVDQQQLTSLIQFENNLLKVHEILIPLKSTHTGSGGVEDDEGGRPELEVTERDDKTDENQRNGV